MADKVRYLLILVCLLIRVGDTKSQNKRDDRESQIEQIAESLAETDMGDLDNPQVLDDLLKYLEKSLNINTATQEELERLHFIDLSQIQAILNYREQYGDILSANELYAIETLSPGTIKALEPFLSFKQPEKIGKIDLRAYQKLLLRSKTTFPFSKGYTSTEDKKAAYPGFPVSLYSRYSLEIPQKLEVGFISDNDAGEDFFRGSNPKGFDHYSGFISWQSKSLIQQVTVGDYSLRFGQGLSFWSSYGMGKSSNSINVMKLGRGIKPYASADENQYFRGIATVLGKGPIKLMLFYSSKNRDANLVYNEASGDTVFTSLKTGGYHRTTSETEDENVLSEKNTGAYIEWKQNKFRLGGYYTWQHFGLDMIKGTAGYKAQSFEGNENINMGIDYQLSLRKLLLFGEGGMSKNLKPAFIQGLTWHAHPQLSMSLYYRNFNPGFHTFYGNPLSEGTEGRNERGLYTGIELYPVRKIKISGYMDFYHFPWLTYSTAAPSSGKDLMIQADFSLMKNISFYLRGKLEQKPQKKTGVENPLDYQETVNKLRFHCEWRLRDNLVLKNRIEYVDYSFDQLREEGFLFYQDIDFSLWNKLNFWFRYAWYDTDGYNSRIYTYENDLLYSFAIPEFHGKGQRMYLNLRWESLKNVVTYLKVGRTIHSGAESWGSGNDMTSGNCRTEVRAEIFLRF